MNPEELKQEAIDAVEQHGIVFIDEIDKICKRGESSGPDVSREGVQRDLLPLVEGCTVSTKHGMVKTDHKIHDHFLMIAQTHRLKDFENERIYEDSAQRYKGLIYPVTAYGDWYGSFIIVFDKKELEKSELYAVEAFVQLLSRQQQQ